MKNRIKQMIAQSYVEKGQTYKRGKIQETRKVYVQLPSLQLINISTCDANHEHHQVGHSMNRAPPTSEQVLGSFQCRA